MTNTTAILNHLQASELIEVREWAKVLWVKAIVAGRVVCRFVSKKIGVTEMGFIEAMNQKFNIKAALWQKHGLTRIYLNSGKLPDFLNVLDGVPQLHMALPKEMKEWVRSNSHLEVIDSSVGASREDTRDNTTKALDAMYGRGGWDRWDREDYEG